MTRTSWRKPFLFLTLAALATCTQAEVLLQYFETDWDEIYRRLPEIAEIGYEGLWTPPPVKSPHAGGQFAGGGNVGYSHFDKFDVGDIPQRGSLGTRYGTRTSLRNMVDNAHQCDIKIYPDIVMNHFGNGPDYRTYPGTQANDFHGWNDGSQPGGFKRPPRMSAYDDVNGGYGYTFQQELCSLIDLQLEADKRFNTGYSNFSDPPSAYVRQPGWDEHYPFGAPGSEDTIAFINRWIHWLGYAVDYDGVRLDAPKHCIADFFGTPGGGFNHEVQVNFDFRHGHTDYGSYDDLYLNYVHREDALIFSEFFIGATDQVDYWRNFNGTGVKMRYLDFPRKSGMIYPAFNSGNLGSLAGFGGFSDAEGVVFCQSHDENPPSKLELAYVYVLTHVGLPVVYFTGNNLSGSDVDVKTWVKIGHGGALGDYNNGVIPNLVYINNQFARGYEVNRWTENDFFVYERFEDTTGAAYDPNTHYTPDTGESLLLVGLNDSGSWQTRYGVQTGFDPGTTLHDYTGNNGSDLTVSGSGQVDLSIPPGINGQGWVCYAPYNASASGDPLRFSCSGTAAGTMNWVVPGGALATNKPRTVTRLTNDTVDIDVYFTPPAGGVDSVIVKWGEGEQVNYAQPIYTNDPSLVAYGYQPASSNASYWRLAATLTNVAEGLHLVRGRCFNARPSERPALFQTFHEAVYVDRHGPDVDILSPAASASVKGDVVAVISNADRTAYQVDVDVDGGGYQGGIEVMKGMWKYNLAGLSSGGHTMTVRAVEADWGSPRVGINTTIEQRVFSVDTSGPAVSLGFTNGQTNYLPFFTTTITASGLDQDDVTLYWDGFELVGLVGTGTLTHTFDGRYTRGGTEARLWGCFVNGPHFFEAVAVNAGATSRSTRLVYFNLYGNNSVDSDGDGLPDDVEMPYFSGGTAPGPNIPWPGDTSGSGNQDMIPNYGETWTRLNPMNADTDYDGVWDGDEDSDFNIGSGDGYNNLCEVKQGYQAHGDPYYYNIYNSGSHPADCDGVELPPEASWSPTSPTRCEDSTLTITYEPNGGDLSNSTPIYIHVGYNDWTNVIDPAMSDIGGGAWQYVYDIPTNATQVDFCFHNYESNIWDNNGGLDWEVSVGACGSGSNYFVMDGEFDGDGHGDAYEVASSGMKIVAAVRDGHLYVATWSANYGTNAGGDDHFVYITDTFCDPQPSPWAKAGSVLVDLGTKPHLVAESASVDGFQAFNNCGASGRSAMGTNTAALEGEIDLTEVFGSVPDVLYISAVAMGDGDGGVIDSQCGPEWVGGSTNEPVEFQRVPIASIHDENGDGFFDGGNPQLSTYVDADTGGERDADYDIRRFFINELAGETHQLTFLFEPHTAGGTNVVSDVELLSNLNRRDFATMEEDLDSVTAGSTTNYYRAYPMTYLGGGVYSNSLTVDKCGAYRATIRYKVNGNTYYYTDHALRRDLAIIVSPKKALDLVMYELNPMTAEAASDDFYGRSTFRDIYLVNTNRLDTLNTNYFPELSVSMIWLQPIHPIGTEGRETDPTTGSPYDPGSPYAVQNYWKVNSVLGDPCTEDQAMTEFTNFVHAMDGAGVGVMLDGTFNHSAWDCEIGEVGVDMGFATNAADMIRKVCPEWYSRAGNYGEHATYYSSASDHNIAVAPDRTDFGKWNDVADFFFGTYDALVQGQDEIWRYNFLLEHDLFDGHDEYTREIWEYFAYYPIYWLEKTGHPAGTPKTESWKGIDGLRCDFAQGLPSVFWEYCINKTRSVKWDFIFMAESLDGYQEVGGSKRHGIGYRSSRHFDVLNENMVFYWRDNYFNYFNPGGATPETYPTWQAYDNRRNAFDVCPLLLNLCSHDELFPSDAQWRLIYAHAIQSAMDGVPMMFYGQEAGAQNDYNAYGGGINPLNNFDRYETNFGKAIPHFKRYNHMTNIWHELTLTNGWKLPMHETYQRINWARLHSPALRAVNNYMLNGTSGWNPKIFVTAKYQYPGANAASQDVVFVAVNNNYEDSTNRFDTYDVDIDSNGSNLFGIVAGRSYNLWDLMAPNPTQYVWGSNKTGTELLNDGLGVWLHENTWEGKQAQYLKLVDVAASYPDYSTYREWDWDNDGLPNAWEDENGTDPNSGSGDEGASGDKDGDGVSNYDEMAAGTRANDGGDFLEVDIAMGDAGAEIGWPSKTNINYELQRTMDLRGQADAWMTFHFATALSNEQTVVESVPSYVSNRFYRVKVKP